MSVQGTSSCLFRRRRRRCRRRRRRGGVGGGRWGTGAGGGEHQINDKLLSNVAFMFNLRSCIEVSIEPCTRAQFQDPKVEKAKKAAAG
jgi:hypothetical protein